MGSKSRGIRAKAFQKSVIVCAALVSMTFLAGFGISYALWGIQSSPLRTPALAQCGQQPWGEYCPGQYTTVGGSVNVTAGIPYVILFDRHFTGGGLPTQTAGIFYEHGHYGYFGLYVPVYETAHGFTLIVNGTEIPQGSSLYIVYHVSIRYLSGTTNKTCTPRPDVFTPTLTESNRQDFSC